MPDGSERESIKAFAPRREPHRAKSRKARRSRRDFRRRLESSEEETIVSDSKNYLEYKDEHLKESPQFCHPERSLHFAPKREGQTQSKDPCTLAARIKKGETFMTPSTYDGIDAVWIFANLSFTAMHAQAAGSAFWKVLTFFLGFPGTLLTMMVVEKGSERAYGIDMPRRPETPRT